MIGRPRVGLERESHSPSVAQLDVFRKIGLWQRTNQLDLKLTARTVKVLDGYVIRDLDPERFVELREHTIDRDNLNISLVEAWLGYTHSFSREYKLSSMLRVQSSEIKRGRGDRTLAWGGLVLTKTFH